MCFHLCNPAERNNIRRANGERKVAHQPAHVRSCSGTEESYTEPYEDKVVEIACRCLGQRTEALTDRTLWVVTLVQVVHCGGGGVTMRVDVIKKEALNHKHCLATKNYYFNRQLTRISQRSRQNCNCRCHKVISTDK